MEAFQGRWESCGEAEGLDEYLEAIGRSEHKEAYKQRVVYDIRVDGQDSITTVMEREGAPPVSTTTKLGVRTEISNSLGTSHMTVSFDGKELHTKQEVDGKENLMRGYLEGDNLFWVSTANGKSIKARMKRI